MTPLLDNRGNMSPIGAADLAASIRAFWLAKGYEGIETRVEMAYDRGKHSYWVVRSNMRNGIPPRWKIDMQKAQFRIRDEQLRAIGLGEAAAEPPRY